MEEQSSRKQAIRPGLCYASSNRDRQSIGWHRCVSAFAPRCHVKSSTMGRHSQPGHWKRRLSAERQLTVCQYLQPSELGPAGRAESRGAPPGMALQHLPTKRGAQPGHSSRAGVGRGWRSSSSLQLRAGGSCNPRLADGDSTKRQDFSCGGSAGPGASAARRCRVSAV